ncbi:MAG: SRPBCC family protein [Myxococcota bacterium]
MTPNEPLAEGTHRHFAHTLTTTAALEAIWELWTDVQTWPSWDKEVESAHLDGPIALGQTGRLSSEGRETRIEISTWNPVKSYCFTTRLPLGSLVITRTLRTGEGLTRLTHDVELRGLGGRLLAPLLGPRFRAALPVVMQRWVELAER